MHIDRKRLGLKTEPHATPPVNGEGELVHILHGGDGYVAYCTACDANVTGRDPYGRQLRATFHAVAYDRLQHTSKEHPRP